MDRLRPIISQTLGIGIFLVLLSSTSSLLWFFTRLTHGPLLLILLLFPAGLWFVRRPWSAKPVRIPGAVIVLISLAAGVLFWTFRMRLLLPPPEGNGDSIFLLEQVPVYTQLFGFRAAMDEILELYVHSRFYWLLKPAGVSIFDSYALLSCFAGVLYTSIVLTHLNNRRATHIAFGAILLLCTPAIVIFSGYIEHYDTPALLVLSTCLYCLRFLEKNTQPRTSDFVLLGILSALTVLFHLITVSMLPALVWFVWKTSADVRTFLRNALSAAVPALILMGLVFLYFLVLAEYPVNPTRTGASHPYPLSRFFTLQHAAEMFNLLMIGMPSLLILVWTMRPRVSWLKSPVLVFLFLLFGGFIGVASIVDPLLGFPADWDLLSLFQIGGNLFLFHALKDEAGAKEGLRIEKLLPGLLALCLTMTALWVERNHAQSEASARNLRHAAEASNQFLASISEDTVYNALPKERRKSAVEVKLFFAGARIRLASREEPRLKEELNQAVRDYDQFLQLPDASYKEQLPAMLARLTELNRRVSALP
jgi:hypothetical protein